MKKYLDEILTAAGVSDEGKRQAAFEIFGNEKVANAFVPRPEYSRSLDEKEKAYNALVQKNAEYYQTEAQRAAQNQKLVEEAVARAQRYEDLYGKLEEGRSSVVSSPALDPSKYVSVEDYQKKIQEVGQQALFVTKEGIKAASDYMYRFQKPLDVDALEKFAVERQLPINLAYQEFIKPEVEAKQNLSFEEKLKAAREEGAREALSRVKLPVDTAPKESTPLLNNLAAMRDKSGLKSEQDRLSSFAEAYSKGNNAS